MHNKPNKAEKCAESRCFWFTVAVSCEYLCRSHSAVVCGGWHLALRHSCLPPPLLSALQWDHVVLLISQQWLYSLPVPLFSAFLSLFTFPHPLLSSSPLWPAHVVDSQTISHFSPAATLTLWILLALKPIQFKPMPLHHSTPTHRAPWSLGCRSPALRVSQEHRSILWQLWSLLRKRKNDYIWSCEDKSKSSRTWVTVSSPTCQSFLIVFPHGHKVLQTGVEMVQNPLLATVHVNS